MVVGVLTCPVASRTVRRCSRPGCGALAVVLLGFDASRSLAWFAPLDDEGALHGSELCHRHAESVRVPKGWWLDDRRVASPQLFNPPPNPPAPPPIAHSGPAEVPPVSKQSSAPPRRTRCRWKPRGARCSTRATTSTGCSTPGRPCSAVPSVAGLAHPVLGEQRAVEVRAAISEQAPSGAVGARFGEVELGSDRHRARAVGFGERSTAVVDDER